MRRLTKVYSVEVEIEDDPATATVHVFAFATSKGEARKMAREEAIKSYQREANGWSLAPRIIDVSPAVELKPVEAPALIAAFCHIGR